MNIQDAINSGKPFKRKYNSHFLEDYDGNVVFEGGREGYRLSIEDAVADDWETKEEAIQITKTQFYKAVADVLKELAAEKGTSLKVFSKDGSGDFDFLGLPDFTRWGKLAEKLGFEK